MKHMDGYKFPLFIDVLAVSTCRDVIVVLDYRSHVTLCVVYVEE
jgi:hypothetical protein